MRNPHPTPCVVAGCAASPVNRCRVALKRFAADCGRRKPGLRRRGLTLLEVILAVVIAATVAAMGLHFMRPTGVHSRQQSCDLTRQTVQLEAGRYRDANGVWPSSDLRQLNDSAYFPNGVPSCPAQGGAYRLTGSQVVCPVHEATRHP